jgi:hypothetical protein
MRMHSGLSILAILALVGCDKPVPNPEVIDPIYRDLQTRKSAADSELNSAKAELQGAYEEMAKAVPQTGELRRARRGVEILRKRVQLAQQNSTYLGILVNQRKKAARKQYLEHFNAKKPWPPPEDFENYKTSRRLRTVSLKWDDRLPVLESRLPSSVKDEKKAAAEAAKKKDAAGGH